MRFELRYFMYLERHLVPVFFSITWLQMVILKETRIIPINNTLKVVTIFLGLIFCED